MIVNQSSFPLAEIHDLENTAAAKPFFQDIIIPNEKGIMFEVKKHKSELESSAISKHNKYPVKSIFTEGKVFPHKLEKSHFCSTPIFLVGQDNRSLRWLSINKNHLKKIRAIGIITNVENKETVQKIEKKTGLTLLTSSIDGLEKVIGITNYPFLILNNWLIQ